MAAHEDWERFWVPPPETTAAISQIRKELASRPVPSLRISRVAQLDASLLDQELESLLGQPLWKAVDALRRPGQRSWEPELLATMRYAVLRMSLGARDATYGTLLQNLKYRNEARHGARAGGRDAVLTSTQKNAYMLLSIAPPYLLARLRDHMLGAGWADEPLPTRWRDLWRRPEASTSGSRDLRYIAWQDLKAQWKRVAWECLGAAERLTSILDLVNFLVFLYNGRYRTLVDRLLRMRLVYAQRAVNRSVSFEYLNRQLVWEVFTEFILFLMPLIDARKLRLQLRRFMRRYVKRSLPAQALAGVLSASIGRALGLRTQRDAASGKQAAGKGAATRRPDGGERSRGEYHYLPSNVCPVCYASSAVAVDQPIPASGDAETITAAVQAAVASSSEDLTIKVPYVTDCGWQCAYCYYCIAAKLLARQEELDEDANDAEDEEAQDDVDSTWTCMRCGQGATGAAREGTLHSEAASEASDFASDSGESSGDESVHEHSSEDEQHGSYVMA